MDQPLLLYDADCGFCTRAASWAKPLGLRVTVAAMQSVELPEHGVIPGQAARELPLVDTAGRVFYGYAAIAVALGTGNPVFRAIGYVMQAPLIRAVSERAYFVIAGRYHGSSGGPTACRATSPPRVSGRRSSAR